MNTLMKQKLGGLSESIEEFSAKLNQLQGQGTYAVLCDLLQKQMKSLRYDQIQEDEAGNVIGMIKGFKDQGDIVLLANMGVEFQNDSQANGEHSDKDKTGLATSIFAGGLIKRSMAPLDGNLIVCCLPQKEPCGHPIKYLFNHFLKGRNIKGIILCEPTDFNINIGNKGKIEYEILIREKAGKAHFKTVESTQIKENLISELQHLSSKLPSDHELGKSSLKVSHAEYGSSEVLSGNEVRVMVDRTFVLEENTQTILKNARKIAQKAYIGDNSALMPKDLEEGDIQLIESNVYKPWKMESHHPLALHSLEVMQDNDLPVSIGYWQHEITDGSYTYGELGLPTIGYGAGSETDQLKPAIEDVEKSIYGTALIVYRHIGMPTFGWDESEI